VSLSPSTTRPFDAPEFALTQSEVQAPRAWALFCCPRVLYCLNPPFWPISGTFAAPRHRGATSLTVKSAWVCQNGPPRANILTTSVVVYISPVLESYPWMLPLMLVLQDIIFDPRETASGATTGVPSLSGSPPNHLSYVSHFDQLKSSPWIRSGSIWKYHVSVANKGTSVPCTPCETSAKTRPNAIRGTPPSRGGPWRRFYIAFKKVLFKHDRFSSHLWINVRIGMMQPTHHRKDGFYGYL
jgi:hypothetical protein